MDELCLKWRFTNADYNSIPTSDLVKIRPFTEEYSNLQWKLWVSDKPNQHHFMLIADKKFDYINDIFCSDCGWGDTERLNLVIKKLSEKLNFDEREPIIFFWSASVAAETEWGIFTKYWTDFCYSSDDSNIIVPPNSEKAIIYVEDRLWVVNRKECFGRS
jgi:hypothetical protein